MSKAIKVFLLIVAFSVFQLWIVSCEEEENDIDPCNPAEMAGELLSATYYASYTPDQVQVYLRLYGAPVGLMPEYTVDAYQISYRTLDKNEELTNASGVIFVPQGIDTLDLLSVQHGTVFKRDEVGSVNPLYAMGGMICAMSGYLVAEPDYLGLGDSQSLHPYLHAKLSASVVVDMIRTARNYACQNDILLSDNLFLAGYSEGGYVTMAAQKIIEAEHSDEFQLMAVAPMAGPYDLLGSMHNIISREYYGIPAYLAYTVIAYNDIYEWDILAEVFQEPYASLIPGLFDGNHDGSEINAELTTNLDSLFTVSFKESFQASQENQIETAIQENTLLDWSPIAPVRLYHGTADSTVFYGNSESAYEALRSNGGTSVDLVPILGANHGSAAFPAYYLAIEWFDSLRTVE